MNRFSLQWYIGVALIGGLLFAGCSTKESSSSASPKPEAAAKEESTATEPTADYSHLVGEWTGRVELSSEFIAKLKAEFPGADLEQVRKSKQPTMPSFIIRDDGTCTMTTMGMGSEGVWSVEGDELVLAARASSENDSTDDVMQMNGDEGEEPMRLTISEDGTELWLVDPTGKSEWKAVFTKE